MKTKIKLSKRIVDLILSKVGYIKMQRCVTFDENGIYVSKSFFNKTFAVELNNYKNLAQ